MGTDKVKRKRDIDSWFDMMALTILSVGLLGINVVFLDWTNDELSAIARAQVNSFSELISEGVQPDGHPFLLQWMVWLMKPWHAELEIMRLPSMIASVATVLVLYRWGKRAMDKKAGLLVALTILVLPPFQVLFVLARPYALSFLITSIGGLLAHRLLEEERINKSLVYGFVFCVLIAAFTHYLACLFLLCVGIWVLVRKKEIARAREFWVASIAGALLFAPHWVITLKQLSGKGLGWLARPSWEWPAELVGLALNPAYPIKPYRPLGWMVCGLILIVLAAVAWRWKRRRSGEGRWTAVGFLAPVGLFLAVLYFYSIWRSPVLQLSATLFAVPMLLLALLVGLKHLVGARWARGIAFFLFLGLGISHVILFPSFLLQRLPQMTGPLRRMAVKPIFERNVIRTVTYQKAVYPLLLDSFGALGYHRLPEYGFARLDDIYTVGRHVDSLMGIENLKDYECQYAWGNAELNPMLQKFYAKLEADTFERGSYVDYYSGFVTALPKKNPKEVVKTMALGWDNAKGAFSIPDASVLKPRNLVILDCGPGYGVKNNNNEEWVLSLEDASGKVYLWKSVKVSNSKDYFVPEHEHFYWMVELDCEQILAGSVVKVYDMSKGQTLNKPRSLKMRVLE